MYQSTANTAGIKIPIFKRNLYWALFNVLENNLSSNDLNIMFFFQTSKYTSTVMITLNFYLHIFTLFKLFHLDLYSSNRIKN